MRIKRNLVGQKFNRLLVLSEVTKPTDRRRQWLCKCDCGNEKIVPDNNLVAGYVKSCGCLFIETMKKIFTTHGHSVGRKTTRELNCYRSMRQRCLDEKNEDYPKWGGRGIGICERWLDEKTGFISFLEDMGKRPTRHTLDRINNDGNYEPSNCKWSTKKQQAENRRSNKWYEYNGLKMILKDWARKLQTDSSNINYFLRKKGKPFNEVVEYYMNKKKAS